MRCKKINNSSMVDSWGLNVSYESTWTFRFNPTTRQYCPLKALWGGHPKSTQLMKTFFIPRKQTGSNLISCFLVFLGWFSVLQQSIEDAIKNSLNWNWPVILSMISLGDIFSDVCSNCLFQTTSSVDFLDVTSYINGEHSSHISGNANWCYFKYTVIIKQSCCSLHPSIFLPLFRLLHLPPTEEKMGIASATLLNLNWTITWNSIGTQWMTKHLMQVHKNAAQTLT